MVIYHVSIFPIREINTPKLGSDWLVAEEKTLTFRVVFDPFP